MDPKKVLDTLQKLGANLSPRTVVILLVVVPLALVALAWLWKNRSVVTKRLRAPKRAAGDSQAALPSVAGNQLRATWRRFLKTLPRDYQRSILSFDHFVVFGDASCGKSTVVDRYTDFRRQAKQFLGSHVFDSYIDLFIGSRSVTMEIAASVLYDVGPKCQTALRRLWRPLYRRCAPTVVVVVDMERLKRADYDLVDYAERLRGKINLLSDVCKRPLEVRVVLTHLDESPGFSEFAELCCNEKIPLYMPVLAGPEQPPVAPQLEAWLEGARGQLSRALVRGGASQLRACVTFLRASQNLPKPLAKFVEVLFAPETFSASPQSGGIYLASPLAAEPNPLAGRPIGQRAPDPRARHRRYAFALAAAELAYLGVAFFTQRNTRLVAISALNEYVPATRENEHDRELRAEIVAFSCEDCGAVARLPDFYREARHAMRDRFSERIREELLIPNLNKVATDGSVDPSSPTNRVRRSLFYLGLIHADRSDTLRIAKDRKRLAAWAEMTELSPALIQTYLDTTVQAYGGEVQFELKDHFNPRDMAPYWLALLNDLDGYMREEQAISGEELKALQARAADAAQALKRFEHDDIVEEILGVVLSSDARNPLANRTRYKLQFEVFGAARKDVDLASGNENAASLGVITQTIRASYVDSPDAPLLATLAAGLSSLYDQPTAGAATKAQSVQIADKTFKFEPTRWAAVVRNAQASELISVLLRHQERDGSIFIPRGASSGYSAVTWNDTNDGSATFRGRATIAPVYTRAAYDALVREPVQKLERALAVASVPKAQKEQLNEFVKRAVRGYAVDYEHQLRAFYAGFGLKARSATELAIAVAQMSVEESEYGAFLHSVHRQVDIDTSGELLIGMEQELSRYAGLRKLFDHGGAEAEVGKYRAILSQLLQDLGKPSETNANEDALTDPAQQTLEGTLNQMGRVALESVRGDKGSYAQLIREWHASLGLSPALIEPFLAPIFELERIGIESTQKLLADAWAQQLAPDLQRISHKFPFDTHDYAEDVSPQELDSLFNPTSGRLFSFVRRYLKPLAATRTQSRYQMRDVFQQRLELPERMLQTVSAGEQLSRHLYDAKGRIAPLTLEIATVPFEHGTDPQHGLTLVYLSVGEASIHNFNQRPGLTTLRIDWTREQISQVGIQLMNLDTQEKLYPEPLATPASSWSALRLLAVAKATPVKKPDNAQLYTWQVRHQPGGARTTAVRFIVLGDPFEMFTLGGPSAVPALALGGAH
ncbi:MAG TPA: type VI secretion protein IcmF/TssM N-terminal domain-containing protein [Polyangiales bacterium]